MRILDLLKLNDLEKSMGIWLSGTSREGEFISWWSTGGKKCTCFYKDNNLHGIYKEWNVNGDLAIHELWEDGKSIEDYFI